MKFDPDRRSFCKLLMFAALTGSASAMLQACGPSGGHSGGSTQQPPPSNNPPPPPPTGNGFINITAGTSVLAVTKQVDPGVNSQPDPRGTQVTSVDGSGRDLVFAVDGVGASGSSDKFLIPAGQHSIQWHVIDQSKYDPANPTKFTILQTVLTVNVNAA